MRDSGTVAGLLLAASLSKGAWLSLPLLAGRGPCHSWLPHPLLNISHLAQEEEEAYKLELLSGPYRTSIPVLGRAEDGHLLWKKPSNVGMAAL